MPSSDGSERPSSPRHDAIREHLARRGASFYREIYAAAGAGTDRDVLDALWDLVWSGEVTNDTFSPLRALRWKRRARDARQRRPGRLTSLGPPEAAGRWSLVDPDAGSVTPTERLHAVALALLERHGVVTREAVAAEGIDGGFSAVYPILRALEEAGRIRRGYFVEGLGAAQFALPGAIDRLRSVRDSSSAEADRRIHLLAAADPANPYGAALAWPRRNEDDRRPFQRAAGAYVVLVDGEAVLYLERGGRSLISLPAAADAERAARAVGALPGLVAPGGPLRELRLERVDRGPVPESRLSAALLEAGFRPSYRGYVLRRA
jgi:ATP-dependent Lhr-like helicase